MKREIVQDRQDGLPVATALVASSHLSQLGGSPPQSR